MKRLPVLLSLLAAIALPLAALAQSAVPLQITYQGRVTDASGNPLGAAAPINRTVTFRIWNHPSAAAGTNRLYSESQNVTIVNGEFSVLVGTGSAVTTETNLRTLDAIFDGSERYLGVTVDDGTAAVDPELSPRQQIVTTAFAFRAKTAESVTAGAITTAMLANNAVTAVQLADSTITAAKLADSTITAAKLADNTITTTKIADGAITAAKIPDGSITSAKLAAGAGAAQWTTTPNGIAYTGAKNIAIGGPADNVPSDNSQNRLQIYANANGRAAIQFADNITQANQGMGLILWKDGGSAGLYNWGGGTFDFVNAGAGMMRFNGDRQIGFGSGEIDANTFITVRPNMYSAPGILLTLKDNQSNTRLRFDANGYAYSTAPWWNGYSDRRLKKDIVGLSGSLAQLLRLRSVEFSFIDPEARGAGRFRGFIAQEVAEVFPDWVITGTDGMLAMGTRGFEALAVQAFRELRAEKDAQIAALEARAKTLEERNLASTQRLEALEQRVNALLPTGGSR